MECMRVIAVMVTRCQLAQLEKLYNARDIAENLNGLLNGGLSTFHVESDTLKKALANEIVRYAISSVLPGRFEIFRSSTRFDIISAGPFPFNMALHL